MREPGVVAAGARPVARPEVAARRQWLHRERDRPAHERLTRLSWRRRRTELLGSRSLEQSNLIDLPALIGVEILVRVLGRNLGDGDTGPVDDSGSKLAEMKPHDPPLAHPGRHCVLDLLE